MAEIDHITLGISRLAFQFSESTRLKGLISSIMTQGNDLEAAHESTIAGRALNTAIGSQLDVIGVIVGQPRTTLSADDGDFFGFWDGTTPNEYLGFSSDGVNDGGVFWDGNTALASRSLSDAEYLRFINAKILRNKARGTHREIVTAIKFLLGDDTEVNVQDSTPGTISIGVSRVLNDAEQAILTDSGLVPISAGVGIESWYAYEPGFSFGLKDGDTGLFPTGSKGLADDTAATPDGDPRTSWAPSTYYAGVGWWVDPANGFIYRPTGFAGSNYAPSGLLEPKWKRPDEVDMRYPWDPGLGFGITLDIEGFTDWLPATSYPLGTIIFPSNAAPGRVYRSGGGISGATPPVWPLTPGSTVSDGSVTWTARDMLHYSPRVADTRDGGILTSSFT